VGAARRCQGGGRDRREAQTTDEAAHHGSQRSPAKTVAPPVEKSAASW